MQSAVQWALLGVVIERPSYGYELARRFQRTYGELLPLSGVSYAYTALDALRRRGLIEEYAHLDEARAKGRRQPKTHYRASANGMACYEEHLFAQMLDGDRREHLFFRKLAMLARQPARALEIIDRYEHASVQASALTDSASKSTAPEAGQADVGLAGSTNHGPFELAGRLRAEARRIALDAKLEWIRYARGQIEQLVNTGRECASDEPDSAQSAKSVT